MKQSIAAILMVVASGMSAQVYHLEGSMKVGGSGGWDYLCADSASRKLYVSHSTEVVVFDMDSLKELGRLEGFGFVHGIVILPTGKKGFISDGQKNEVVVFDPSQMRITGHIPTDANPNSMVYNKMTNRLFVGHKPSRSLDAIDPDAEKLTSKIHLHGIPEFPVSDSRYLYVNIDDTGEIARVDTKTLSVSDYWKMNGCERPSGLAIDPQRRRLFSTCRNGVITIVSADDGKVIASLPSGQKPDAARFDPEFDLAFSSGGDGTLTVLGRKSGDAYYVKQTVSTLPSARTMALDERTHRLFLSAAELGPPDASGHASAKLDTFRVLVVGPETVVK